MWGRGAELLHRAGGGVAAPPPLPRLTILLFIFFCAETARSVRGISTPAFLAAAAAPRLRFCNFPGSGFHRRG